MDYRHEGKRVFLINYHLVWIPRRRRPVLVGKIPKRLTQIIQTLAAEKNWQVMALEVKPDHVHCFVSADPSTAPHKIVKAIKGRSSNMLRKEFPELLKLPSLWTRSYFCSTAGNVSNETIRRYIEAQSKK